MAANVGSVEGEAILHDKFTKTLHDGADEVGKFEEKLTKMGGPFDMFSDDARESFGAVAGAVGLASAALAAFVVATYEMAQQGSFVADVSDTLDHFAGSAENAEAVLNGLRKGVADSVDDLTLMQQAALMLGAGVKLTAGDFETLGGAARVLQNRGLGTTTEMLEMVSQAMVTGRTRALAMKLGVVDLGDAAEQYAEKLGVNVSQLSEVERAEATRTQIMKMLSAAVADAGEQEKDFGEKVDTAHAQFTNWLNDLSVAVTQSPVLTSLVDSLGSAFEQAFSQDKEENIRVIVDAIEEGIIFTTNIGIATVEAARVIYSAWNGVKSVVLGLLAGFMELGAGIARFDANVREIGASLPGATQQMKDMAVASRENANVLSAMSSSLDEQAQSAFAAATGNSEFHQTLDKTGGALFAIKDALIAAKDETKLKAEATSEHSVAVNSDTESIVNHSNALTSSGSALKQQAAGLVEATKLYKELSTMRVEQSGTTTEREIADIMRWQETVTARVRAAKADTADFYTTLAALSKEKLDAVGIDWELIRSKSIASLEDIALRAKKTYDEMALSSQSFVKGALEAQNMKFVEADYAAKNMGESLSTALARTKAEAEKLTAEWLKNEAAAVSMASGIGAALENVEQEIKTVQQATLSWNEAMDLVAHGKGTMGGTVQGGMGNASKETVRNAAQQGRYFGPVDKFGDPDYAALGLKGGTNGYRDFGEGTPAMLHGIEKVVPFGKEGAAPIIVNVTMNVNGTGSDVARQFRNELDNVLKSTGRRW